jgi:hypothetical protein
MASCQVLFRLLLLLVSSCPGVLLLLLDALPIKSKPVADK